MPVPGELRGWRWLERRAGRAEYWLWLIVLVGWNALLGFSPSNPVHYIVSWLITFQVIRRLHDLALSGWWVLAGVVSGIAIFGVLEPVLEPNLITVAAGGVDLIGLVILGLLPGTKGANRFGAPPGRLRLQLS